MFMESGALLQCKAAQTMSLQCLKYKFGVEITTKLIISIFFFQTPRQTVKISSQPVSLMDLLLEKPNMVLGDKMFWSSLNCDVNYTCDVCQFKRSFSNLRKSQFVIKLMEHNITRNYNDYTVISCQKILYYEAFGMMVPLSGISSYGSASAHPHLKM